MINGQEKWKKTTYTPSAVYSRRTTQSGDVGDVSEWPLTTWVDLSDWQRLVTTRLSVGRVRQLTRSTRRDATRRLRASFHWSLRRRRPSRPQFDVVAASDDTWTRRLGTGV